MTNIKNKAASMALFATMMAVGTLPLASQVPSDYFLEHTSTVIEKGNDIQNTLEKEDIYINEK